MNITAKDIIDFVNKAISNQLNICLNDSDIKILRSDYTFVSIVGNSEYLNIITKNGQFTVPMTYEDCHKYLVLIDDVKAYCENRGIRDIVNFFGSSDEPTNIDSLYEED